MRILYIADLNKTFVGTATQRGKALERLGHSVTLFDLDPYSRGGSFLTRLRRSAAYRLGWGFPVGKLFEEILLLARRTPCDWVWIDRGYDISPDCVRKLREATGALLIHYTPDPGITFHRTRAFIKSIPLYDVLITTKSFEMGLYRRFGARKLIYVSQGIDTDMMRPMVLSQQERADLGSDVCFIGHCEEHYLRCVQTAVGTGAKVAVWGPGWLKKERSHKWLSTVYRGRGVWGVNYAKALSAAKIGLGLLSKYMPEAHTTRTFEVPACGTFMLAERTDEQQAFFREGEEADFFSDQAELSEKLKYYLAHDPERERIALAGRKRCESNGCNHLDRMKYCIEQIMLEATKTGKDE